MTEGPSTQVTRLRAKQRTELAALHALLDTTFVGHFAVTDGHGHPVVFPTAIARDGDHVLAHGSTGSPWMRALAAGAPTSLAVTALDGLVVARSTFESSLHYRSAVLFGACSAVRDADKPAALDVLTDAMLPGRAAEVRRPWPRELAATLVLSMPIEQWSLKISDGWPDDEDADIAGDAWAGVVPMHTRRGTPVPAPDLRAGIAAPASLRQLPDAP
ncbi:pyridoxamine 5'-phosphate oxidase family protein [uncultured Jatrophihabitans sp.]|uniref:pyridoxamine 5'-phosphate oxidase family protein n=1 Tax=uncultured Jatrophihabitans sp. TaxID=1610747 RepID=UPI0035CACF9B